MNLSDFKEEFTRELQKDYSSKEIELSFKSLSRKYFNGDISETEDVLLDNTLQKKLEDALIRLKQNQPLEYILNEVEFYGRMFKVNPNVHIPRPESETMVQWVLQDFQNIANNGSLCLLDIGTGAGVLPITLKKEMPKVSTMAIDISEKALAIARENANLLNASVEFVKTDLFQLDELPQRFDIIVSNPPYILKHAQKDVQRKILKHEPPIALYIEDSDPMIFNRKIAQLAQKGLNENGAVYLEINQYLKSETEKLFHNLGFETTYRKDIYRNPRTIKAVKK